MKKFFENYVNVFTGMGVIISTIVGVHQIKDTKEEREVYMNFKKQEKENSLYDELEKCQECMKYFGDLSKKHKEEFSKKAYESDSIKTEGCRQSLSRFWAKVKELDENNFLPKNFFDYKKKPWLCKSMNYMKLVEPMERTNYYNNGFDKESGEYEDGDNRPSVFPYIEKKIKEQKTQYPKEKFPYNF